MILLRLIGLLVLLELGALFVAYLVTGDRRWLGFARNLLRWAVVLAVVFMLFYLFERLVMII